MKPVSKVRLLVSSGDGPAECRLAVSHALKRIEREANDKEQQCHVTLPDHGKSDGPPSALVSLSGDRAAQLATRWIGTVQWISQSPFRPNHKRRNWFIGIFALKEEADLTADIQNQDLRFETFRAGGPGGQHQNTTDSAVRLTHIPTGISVISRDQRSQLRNKQVAQDRLADKLLLIQSQGRADARSRENQMHKELERGNPVRVFKGKGFVEK